jgi:hypothetical protein
VVPVAGQAPPDIDTEADYAALIATISQQPASVPPRPAHRPGTREAGGGQG